MKNEPTIIQDFTWNLNAACIFEQAAGHSIADLNEKSSVELRLLIWAGIKASGKHDHITPEEVGQFIDASNVERIKELIAEKMNVNETIKNE